MRKSLIPVLLIISFIGGWLASQHYRASVPMPMGAARLEVPRTCKSKIWMNGIETDCKDGATIYYVSKLKQASPQ